MEQKEGTFIFESYSVLPDKKEVEFYYKYQDLKFTEKILLPKQIPSTVNPALLTKTLESLHPTLGVSY